MKATNMKQRLSMRGRVTSFGSVLLGVAALSAMCLVGCNKNDLEEYPGNGGGISPATGGASGSGGTAGSAGSAGSSGSSGSAGSSGSSGSSGSAGSAGTPSPNDVVIQTYNVAMAGAFIPYVTERQAALPGAIDGLDADLICIQEAWDESVKQQIKTAVQGKYQAVWFVHDDDSVVTDTNDAQGNPVAPFSTPPCADAVTALNDALDCVRDKCSTVPGDDAGYTTSTTCVSSMCASKALPLFSKPRCYGCLAPSLPVEKIGDIRTRCNDPAIPNPLGFRGQSGTMLLSKLPIVGTPEDHLIPAAWNRRNIIGATVTAPSGKNVDVYCAHLTPIFRSAFYPYTGQHGANEDGSAATGAQAWENEQYLQAKKLIDWAASRSGANPAIIIGDMNAGKGAKTGSAHPYLVDEGARTIDRFEAVYTHALAADYDPGCTFCPPEGDPNTDKDLTNPLVSSGERNVYIDHVFLKGIDASKIKSSTRNFTEFDVSVEGGSKMIPHSDHFGYTTTVTIE
ncbi:MAG: endonuclease/exonuclease/phosphatase family protein [Polyangiaceae bacterium]